MKRGVCEDRVMRLSSEVRREWILKIKHLTLHAVRNSRVLLWDV